MFDRIITILESRKNIKQILFFENTKIRAVYGDNLFLDIYYNPYNNRYDVSLIFDNKRILGWDNAPHHTKVSTHPHHRHEFNQIYESNVKDLIKDLPKLLDYIDMFISKHKLLKSKKQNRA